MRVHTHFLAKALQVLTLVTFFSATLFVSAGRLQGQEVTATITGQVTDPSGAAIPVVTVTATDTVHGTVWPTETNPGGFYNLPRLPVGTYNLKVEAKGFETYIQSNILLQLNDILRINVEMKVGAVTQTVEVTGQAPMLHTDSMQLGYVTNSVANVDLPLATRNFAQLTLLAPGVTTDTISTFENGQRTTGNGRPYVNGNRKEANNFLLSGIDNNLVSDNLTAYFPSVDAIEEFNMITNNAPAEFGNFEGGVINVEIKSGTNKFHGDLFEFFRNDKLNAVPWANNWTVYDATNPARNAYLKRPAVRWNMFGGTIGGPIKKDKLFFFFDYQDERLDFPPKSPGTPSVITAAERQGDFTAWLTKQPGVTKTITLTNPCASLTGPCQAPAAGTTPPAFPTTNVIPIAMIDAVAKNLFASPLYPAPIPGLGTGAAGLQNNQLNFTRSETLTGQWDARLDVKPTDKSSYFGRFSLSNQEIPGFNSFPLSFNTFNHSPFRGSVFDFTRTFGPTLVNDVRLGFNRSVLWNGGLDNGEGNVAQNLGIQNGNDRGPGLMGIAWSNGDASPIGSANIGTQQDFVTNEVEAFDTLSLTRGRHFIKTGFQEIRQEINAFYSGNNGRTGFMTFNGQFTGVAEADFFLGLPEDIGRGLSSGTWGHRSNVLSAFVQDNWRTTKDLTLNLGLRWEDHTPWIEVDNRESNFSPFTGTQYLAGQSCPYSNCNALYNSYNKDFQPRIGFAWTPPFLGGKTVVRGAYTISSFLEGTGTNLRLTLNPPFETEYENIYSGFSFPSSTTDQGLTTLQAKDPYKNATIRLWDPNVRPSEVQQWNLTIEHQLPSQMLFSIGYVGQHGTHLMVPMPYFQKRYVGEAGCTAAAATTINVSGSGYPSTPVQVCTSPYLAGNPALASIAQISGTESRGSQRYGALQASLSKRLSQGMQFQLSYTYSKSLTNAIGYYGGGGQSGSNAAYFQNLYNAQSEWGRAYFDDTHTFSGSYIYDLPYGKDRKFGRTANPVARGVLGDWELTGIVTLHTGFPLTMKSNDLTGTASRGPKASCIAAPQFLRTPSPSGGIAWYSPSSFIQPPPGTMGTCGNNTVEGPGGRQWDVGLLKDFPIHEAIKMEFRAEFLNFTNTPLFNSPASQNVNSSLNGIIQSAQYSNGAGPRNIQFALKLYF
jgi:hypothetical protein